MQKPHLILNIVSRISSWYWHIYIYAAEGQHLKFILFFCLHYFLQKFLDRCIVEEGDPEDEDYKVTSLQETLPSLLEQAAQTAMMGNLYCT